MSTAEELCRRALNRDANKVIQCWNRNDEQKEREHNKGEGEAEELGPRLEESDKSLGLWATPIWL